LEWIMMEISDDGFHLFCGYCWFHIATVLWLNN
jgi:hypothetical protein